MLPASIDAGLKVETTMDKEKLKVNIGFYSKALLYWMIGMYALVGMLLFWLTFMEFRPTSIIGIVLQKLLTIVGSQENLAFTLVLINGIVMGALWKISRHCVPNRNQ